MEPQESAVTWRIEGRTYFGGHGEGGWGVGTSRWMDEKRETGQIDEGGGGCLQRQDWGMSRGMNWEGGDEMRGSMERADFLRRTR